jgi:hypothetical protein
MQSDHLKVNFRKQRPQNGMAAGLKVLGIEATQFNSNVLPNFGKSPNVTP